MWNSQQTFRPTVKWRESGEREGEGVHAANGHRSVSKPGQCFLTKLK